MSKSSRIALALIAGLALLTGPAAADGHDTTLVIRADRIHTVSGEVIVGGSIVIKGGKVVAVGKSVTVPEGAKIIHAPVVIPGMVDAYTFLAGTAIGDAPLTASRKAATNYDRHRSHRSTLAQGVTTAYVAATGRLVSGQGAVVRLGGPVANRILVESASLEIGVGATGLNPPSKYEAQVPPATSRPHRPSKPSYPSTRMAEMAVLRHLLDNAKTLYANGPSTRPEHDVWGEVMAGKLPLFVRAEKASDILRVLGLADHYRIKIVLVGATEAYKVADEIARRGVPVIVRGLAAADRWKAFNTSRLNREGQGRLDTAATLARAGIPTAIAVSDPTEMGQLLVNAAVAIRNGMTPAQALAAVTLSPAKALGISDRCGHIATGTSADLVLLSGDPFGVGTQVQQVLIAGSSVYRRRSLPDRGLTPSLPLPDKVIAIRAGTILTVSRGVIQPGVILVSRGKILRVGGSDLRIPKGATVIDASNMVVAPGMIDIDSHIGISRRTIPGLFDTSPPLVSLARAGTPLHLAVRPGDPVFREALSHGMTSALLTPLANAQLGGGASLIKLSGKSHEDMLIEKYAAVKFGYSGNARRGIPRTSLGKAIEGLLNRGKKYHETWEKYEEKKRKGTLKKEDKPKTAAVKKNDPISGTWDCGLSFRGRKMQSFKLKLQLEGNTVTGSMDSRGQSQELDGGEWNGATKQLKLLFKSPMGSLELNAELIEPNQLEGEIAVRGFKLGFEAERTSATGGGSTRRRDSDRPKVDRKMEPFRPLFRGDAPALVFATTADEIKAVLETFHDKFKLGRLVLVTATAAQHIPKELTRRGVPVLFNPQGESERAGTRYYLPAILHRKGVSLAFGSGSYDAAVLLPLAAAQMTRHGLSADAALRAVTITPARILGQEHRIGSIEPGKDADLVFWTAHPMALSSRVERVMQSGSWVYSRPNGGRR